MMNLKIHRQNPLLDRKNIKLLLMLISLSFSTVFRFIPDIEHERFKPYTHNGEVIMIDTWALPLEEGYRDFFLFSDQKLTLETHLFFLFEHLILVALSVALRIDENVYKGSCAMYIIIQSFDTLIYVLAYGSFRFSAIPVSWDVLKIAVFCFSAVKEINRRYEIL